MIDRKHRVSRSRKCWGVLVVCLVIFGCGGPSTEVSPTKAPDAPPAVATDDPSSATSYFCVGRIPFNTPSLMVKRHERLFDRLAKLMGYDRGLMVTAPDYEGVLALLRSGRVNVAWLGTVAYARAKLQGEAIVPLVCPVRNGKYTYHGAVICRKDARLEMLDSLKGKRMAFVEPDSASGYLYARDLLIKAGLRIPGDLLTREHGAVDFLGRHDSVVLAVYTGRYDAGAVYEGAVAQVFRGQPAKADELEVIALTSEIYNEPVVVRGDTPQLQRERIRSAFLSVSIEDPAEQVSMGQLEGFRHVGEGEYQGVIDSLTALRKR